MVKGLIPCSRLSVSGDDRWKTRAGNNQDQQWEGYRRRNERATTMVMILFYASNNLPAFTY